MVTTKAGIVILSAAHEVLRSIAEGACARHAGGMAAMISVPI